LQHNNFGDARGGTRITEIDFDPPRPLSIAARQVFDRHAKRIHSEGRWSQVDHDLLCLFAETTELYLRFKKDIDDQGARPTS
jgi:phage terminase small subunit